MSLNLTEHLARAATAALVGAVVTGGAFLLTAASKVSRHDMVDHVDREIIPITLRLSTLETLLRQQIVQNAKIETKLDILLRSFEDEKPPR